VSDSHCQTPSRNLEELAGKPVFLARPVVHRSLLSVMPLSCYVSNEIQIGGSSTILFAQHTLLFVIAMIISMPFEMVGRILMGL
jgi:hypothetical protein